MGQGKSGTVECKEDTKTRESDRTVETEEMGEVPPEGSHGRGCPERRSTVMGG